MNIRVLAGWLLVRRAVPGVLKGIACLPILPYRLARSLTTDDLPPGSAVLLGVGSLALTITYAITFRFGGRDRMPDFIGIPAIVCLVQYVIALGAYLLSPVWQEAIEEAEQMQSLEASSPNVLLRSSNMESGVK